MSRNHWHILREDDALTLARRVPVRFDLGVETRLEGGDSLRIATQVRQDVWRALRGLRGFAPAVRVERDDTGLTVTAGGQVDVQVGGTLNKAQAEARIAEVLQTPANRARWVRWAT